MEVSGSPEKTLFTYGVVKTTTTNNTTTYFQILSPGQLINPNFGSAYVISI